MLQKALRRTIELSNKVGGVQSSHEREMSSFLRQEPCLLILRCFFFVSLSRSYTAILTSANTPSPFAGGMPSLGCGSPPFRRCDIVFVVGCCLCGVVGRFYLLGTRVQSEDGE
jgi:hypothetical protein